MPIPWYIMTSPATHDETVAFFRANEHFGLAEADIFFFQQVHAVHWMLLQSASHNSYPAGVQGMLPCLTTNGRIIMSTHCSMATAPDGNGGVYAALARCGPLPLTHRCTAAACDLPAAAQHAEASTGDRSGALEDMRARGVERVDCFSVDNALIQPASPVFVGACADQDSDCGEPAWEL